MLLLLDNRDSFTFNLAQAAMSLGADVVVLSARRTSLADIRSLAPEHILIGPGPGRPEGAGCSLEVLRELGGRIPILGVCLGHQAIGAAFGARIGPSPELIHGRAVEVEHDGRGVFRGLTNPGRFTRYNSLSVLPEAFPACLEISATTSDGDIQGLRHRELPIEGVQFHPESILSEEGGRLLGNFLGG